MLENKPINRKRRTTSMQLLEMVQMNLVMPLWWKKQEEVTDVLWTFPVLFIMITGQHRNGIISARTRIDVLVETFRKKQPFTHFLSFELNQAAIQEKFLQFKEEVLEKCSNDSGVSSSLFQNPAKLHLTIGTLVLLNEQEIKKAQELLQKCKEDFTDTITGGKPLTIEVAGIEYMNDDPAMIDVLYAKVYMKDGSNKLQLIADRLMDRFVTSGLMMKEWDRVKLHATVMNTVFRKDPSAEEQNNRTAGKAFKERESFDGRKILKLFENFRFGEVQLNSIFLSQRFSTDSSGYYATSGQITFSSSADSSAPTDCI
ncbi:activating signal cointegrator 1 complex subunit 1 isoform X2 [Sceloporus undulatus]|uniref:activating signal cointegrator 1 complex subunit 1 isoform X2 n=1 Tax=Sceloporus undulatus TaxID=8520 RepID=UPI001C4C81D9|nr:activating signal cointegrator 1 complex subunit 1 isoform X2 [Sceloporus undulatus]XP_042313396.1 activating signal cointegrator 1 complex subunit 1 isoform X2 [Sceloporus undulatus]